MYKSVKSAIGHYAAMRRGPKLAQGKMQTRVQSDQGAGESDWIRVGVVLFSPEPHGMGLHRFEAEALIGWATRADEAETSHPALSRMLSGLSHRLRSAGLLTERPKLEGVEGVEFEDLNTGEVVHTVRLCGSAKAYWQ